MVCLYRSAGPPSNTSIRVSSRLDRLMLRCIDGVPEDELSHYIAIHCSLNKLFFLYVKRIAFFLDSLCNTKHFQSANGHQQLSAPH